MDLFSRMAQGTVTDLSVFRAKRSQKEKPKAELKTNPKPLAEEKNATEQAEQSLPMTQRAQEEAQETPAEKPKAVEQKLRTAETEEKASAVEQKKPDDLKKEEEAAKEPSSAETQKTESAPVESAAEEKPAPKMEQDEDTPAAEAKPEENAPVAEQEEEKGRIIQFKQPENPNEEAAVKLEMQLETAKSNLLPVFPIVRYLKNKCMSDDTFASAVNDERKTLAKCFEYVTGEVKKALHGANGWLDDNEVYAYAETYFLTDEAVFEQIAAEKAEEERKRQEKVAQRRKEQEEKRKKAAAERRKEKTAEKKKAAKETKKAENESTAEGKAKVPESAEQPVMQEQLCLQM